MRLWICGAVTTVILASLVQCQQQFTLPEAEDELEELDEEGADLSPSPASVQYRLRPYDYSDEVEDQQPIHQVTQAPQLIYTQQRRTSPQPNPHPHPPQQKVYKKLDKTKQQLLEELESEEPDRLSLLLEKSSFKCNGRTTGYYADETLGCEVFHYCQDNARHSWICPEGFTFHQVHLICMPASEENICEQSAKYHFVNEYLYKPINMEEHQTRPNVTLRYSERYYPDEIYQDERQDYYNERVYPERQHEVSQQQIHYTRQPIQAVRKVPVPTPQPYRPVSSTPHNTVFRSPEEINISLQQRRPPQHIFQAQATSTTARYDEDEEEDEYSYERK